MNVSSTELRMRFLSAVWAAQYFLYSCSAALKAQIVSIAWNAVIEDDSVMLPLELDELLLLSFSLFCRRVLVRMFVVLEVVVLFLATLAQ